MTFGIPLQCVYTAVNHFRLYQFQKSACFSQLPESNAISHKQLPSGRLSDCHDPFFIDITNCKWIMANGNTIVSVKTIVGSNPNKSYGIFIETVDNKIRQSIIHSQCPKSIRLGISYRNQKKSKC